MSNDELVMFVCGVIIGSFTAIMLALLAISTETDRQAEARRQELIQLNVATYDAETGKFQTKACQIK